MSCSWSRPAAICTIASDRVWANLTGRRNHFDNSGATNSSGYQTIFEPKPPPTSGAITRQLAWEMSSQLAR
jgi:hypothetical protein